MDAQTKLRLLLGPVRPFIAGKLRDAFMVPLRTAYAKRTVPVSVTPRSVSPVVPVPSAQWCMRHAPAVRAAAEAFLAGRVEAYGIDHWQVGDSDPVVEDIRSVHELSRMHPWCSLALCATLDPSRAEAWRDAALHSMKRFVDAYPPHHGTHWLFPMGIAIRALSMTTALGWLRHAQCAPDAATEACLAASLIDHGILLRARREFSGGMTTSHYLANMTGILAIGAAVDDAYTKGWYAEARTALDCELHRQLLDDGFGNEASTGYHRQILDLFLAAATIIKGQEGALPDAWRDRLTAAVGVQRLLDVAGMPLIGDNDDGMAYKLTGYAPDTSYLYAMAEGLGIASSEPANHLVLSCAGIDVYQPGRYDVVLRAGPIGQYGKGGHAHNDQTSIIVRIGGRPIIIDPGSSTYTGNPHMRNSERSVAMHCVMTIDGEEQNIIPGDGGEGLFWLLGDRCNATVLQRTQHEWIATMEVPAITRCVKMHSNSIEIEDVHRDGMATLVLTIPLAPGLTVDCDTDAVTVRAAEGTLCRISFAGYATDGTRCPLSIVLEKGWMCPRFGERVPNTLVRVRGRAERVAWRLDLDTDGRA